MYIGPFQLVCIIVFGFDRFNLFFCNLYLVGCDADITVNHVRVLVVDEVCALVAVYIVSLFCHNLNLLRKDTKHSSLQKLFHLLISNSRFIPYFYLRCKKKFGVASELLKDI